MKNAFSVLRSLYGSEQITGSMLIDILEDYVDPEVIGMMLVENGFEDYFPAPEDDVDDDHETFMKQMNYWNGVKDANDFKSIWSIYEVTDCNDLHPYTEAATLEYEGWDEKVIVDIEGPTWLDLYRTAEKAITQSDDLHHLFIEAFRVKKGDATVLTMVTGS